MDTEKRTRADVTRIKLAKARSDYSQVISFFRNMTSGFELAIVREQKLLFGLPQPVLAECIDFFCSAADRILSKEGAIYARNYAQFVEQVLWIRERIDRNFRSGLDAIKPFTFGDVALALDIWLKESYEHISDQAWKRSSSNRELASNLPQKLAALTEETFQNQIGNTNEIAFAGARLLNEIAATIGCATRSSIGAKRRQRLTDALPGLVSLANKWNGTQYTIDKISYGEWRVKSVSREECRIELVDSQLDLSRVLALRRGAIQRLKKSRGSDFTSTYLGKQLSDFLPHFLEAVLDEMHATYDFQLTTPEYWDLRNALKRRLSEIGAEDDLLLLASEENSARVMSDYLSCISVRWYFDICEFLSSHISKRKQRTGQLSSLSLTSLVAMLPLGPEDRKNVRQSLEEFCSCPPRKSFYSVLNHPFFLLEDGSIAGISALDGGQWTAMVRSKWIQSGDIGSRYGRGWEQYLIWVLDGKHWSVLARNINLKQTKTKCCEIDLLIGRDDVCLLVQVKSFAGLGMNMYDHWKNRQVIEKGIAQAKMGAELLSSHYQLSDVIGRKAAKAIKIVRPVVLSTLHYFNGWSRDGVSVVSVSALENLMRGATISFWNPSGKKLGGDVPAESRQLTGRELLDFLDNPVDWRISEGTGVFREESVVIDEFKWLLPCIGADGKPFEIHADS